MIRENILKIKERISSICSKSNRDCNSITIVAVSKGRTVQQIREAIEAGITDIGENRVQEALLKYNAIRTTQYAPHIKWHMVGHLQTNKVKDAVRIFDLIQSVDSIHLASEMDKQAAKINKIQDILIEVNPVRSNSPKANAAPSVRTSNGVKTSPEATKFGVKPEEAIEVIKDIADFKHINIKGLMTIAPLADNPEKARPYFKMLRELMDGINESRITNHESRILSMGMTDDFEAAIEEGSNTIRLGRAIFENAD